MNERSQPTGRFGSGVAILALCLGSCSSVKVESDRKAAAQLTSYETYAWSSVPPPPIPGAVDDDLIARLVRRSVDEDLASVGLRLVPEDEARLLVTQQLSVAIRQQVNDPYYSVTRVERYEEGSLKIAFVHRETKETVWSGTGRCRLRTVSRDVGLNRQEFADAKTEKRSWPVEELVDAILEDVRRAN